VAQLRDVRMRYNPRRENTEFLPLFLCTNSTLTISAGEIYNSVKGEYTYINITAPGKKGASTKPRKNLETTSPVKDWQAAWHADMTPLGNT
jgi:hypothetical protein